MELATERSDREVADRLNYIHYIPATQILYLKIIIYNNAYYPVFALKLEHHPSTEDRHRRFSPGGRNTRELFHSFLFYNS